MDTNNYNQDSSNCNWPFQPRWLSIRDGVNESEVNPNTDGLFLPDTLRGFITEISDIPEIENPISLFQMVPANYPLYDPYNRIEVVGSQNEFIKNILKKPLPKGWKEDGMPTEISEKWKIIRIDPGKLYTNKDCCDKFRDCEGGTCKSKCFNLHSRIALFYDEALDKIHYFGKNDEYVTTFKRVVDKFNQTLKADEKGQKDEPIIVDDREEIYDPIYNASYRRLFVTYRCKYSGLDEYFFPIFHAGKVIAVIMQGQRSNAELKTYPISLGERIKDAIFGQVITLARRVNTNVNLLSQQYVSSQFQCLEKDFRSELKTINSTEIDVFDRFRQILNKTLHDIFYTFNGTGFIRIYSFKNTEQKQGVTSYEFELIGNSDCTIEEVPYSTLTFSNLPVSNKNCIEGEELIQALEGDKTKYIDLNHTFRLEISFVLKMSYIIWKSYNINRLKHSKQLQHYGDSWKLYYHVLLEPYIILKEVHFEDLLEKSIRVSIHETAQVIPPIIQTLNSYFEKDKIIGESELDYYSRIEKEFKDFVSNPRNFKELSKKIYDINNRLELLDGLYQRSALVFKKIEPCLKWEDFHRIIFSIKSLFEEKAFLNNRQEIAIHFESVYSKLDLYTDRNFLIQILFNLVDNAIKYGLRGSKINIKIKISDGYKDLLSRGIIGDIDNQTLQITVENFGDQISTETHEKLFDLYYRDPRNLASEGLGIGLFLVMKLCHALGYSIQCELSEWIGDTNYPIYYHAHKEDRSKVDKLLRVVDGSALSINVDRIVNKTQSIDWEITAEELQFLLRYPVYSNKFGIIIPINISNIQINR